MRLLLDAHVPIAVASQLQQDGIDIVALQTWQAGVYRHAPDEEIIAAALADKRVLVTFDRRTIPPLLTHLVESELHHAGVVLVDHKTIRQDDIGGLVRALLALTRDEGELEWQDRLVNLRPRPGA